MGPFKSKSLTYCGIILLCYYNINIVIAETGGKGESQIDDDLDEEETAPPTQSTGSDFDIEYITPTPSGPVYFSENFDDFDIAKKKWVVSRAQKEEQDNVFKYDGRWEFELPQRQIFPLDRALVLRSSAKHAAISAKLEKRFDFKDKPLFVQYEVNFQNGMDCGGAYIKLLSYSKEMKLDKFQDKSPYTIMFGPDKCGSDVKLHFIFRHKNPVNGSFEEKHAKKPSNRVEDIFTDKKPHVYRLVVRPDNNFEVHVDGRVVNKGKLLEDMEPPVNPPKEIEDPNDKKPADWDEREKIPDPTAVKPDDWDDNAPPKIPDPKAVKPEGWLDNEPEMIPDPSANVPDDWDESMDGSWEAPLLSNPACKDAIGCGPWSAPMIENPSFKGKWKPPMISNANYKGKWTRRKIANPDYFEDKEPFKMTSIGAVGLEIWTMTDMVLFDNFIITDDEDIVNDWTTQTYELKRRVLDRDSKTWYGRFLKRINYKTGTWSLLFLYCLIPILVYVFYLCRYCKEEEEGVVSRIVNYSNAHPWLWAIYIFVIGLPLVLFFTFCCGNNQDKKVDDSRNKKTDEVTEDDANSVPAEKNSAPSKEKQSSFLPSKVKVGTKKDQLEKTENESEDEEEEEEEENAEDEEEEEEEEDNNDENNEEDNAEEVHSVTPPLITKRRTRKAE